MLVMNATDVRKDWSTVVEGVIREKPQFIKRTRDYMMLADIKLLAELLEVYKFTATKYVEDDGSVTLSLNEIDLAENAPTEDEARHLLGKAILEYAEDYYSDFVSWSSAPNRKGHIPYVLKALISKDAKEIGDRVECKLERAKTFL